MRAAMRTTARRLWVDRNLTPEVAKRRKQRIPDPPEVSLEEFDA